MKQNVLSVLLALICATLIFFVLRLSFGTQLQNNIIWVDQEPLLWDIIAETYQDRLDIVSNSEIVSVSWVSVIIFFDPDEVSLVEWDISSRLWDVRVSQQWPWRATVFVSDMSWVQPKDTLFSIWVTWDSTRMTISDAVFLFDDGESERASVSMR